MAEVKKSHASLQICRGKSWMKRQIWALRYALSFVSIWAVHSHELTKVLMTSSPHLVSADYSNIFHSLLLSHSGYFHCLLYSCLLYSFSTIPYSSPEIKKVDALMQSTTWENVILEKDFKNTKVWSFAKAPGPTPLAKVWSLLQF